MRSTQITDGSQPWKSRRENVTREKTKTAEKK
jgi:hypothetical protein